VSVRNAAAIMVVVLGLWLISEFFTVDAEDVQKACGHAGVASFTTNGFWPTVKPGGVVVCRDGHVVAP
jgi:putative Mn2+ efflux pump MntP